MPEFLYYNCDAPDLILGSLRVLPSKTFSCGGVSMSAWPEMGSHGPFKIAFKQALWFQQFIPVVYGSEPSQKNPMFTDEQEWNSPTEVRFSLEDVVYVMFMQNAPCVLGPRQLKWKRTILASRWPELYREGIVADPYLSR